MNLQQNYSLRALNTFGIEAFAKVFTEINSSNDLKELVEAGIPEKNDVLILGGGSNILLTKDFEGVVVKVGIRGKTIITEDENHVYINVGAGENWHEFVLYCINNNYAGIENLSLIPGNVGASPMQNIGAYGVEIKEVFDSLNAINIKSGESRTFSWEECEFGYRDSVFKNKLRDQYVICDVTFRLNKNPIINTSYGAIEQELERMNITDPGISDISNAVCNIRRSKLPDPAEIGNAGSFFKNPVIDNTKFRLLQEEYSNIVGYPVSENETKLAAGWLIENAGWKGKRFGNYGVHDKQALVLVNDGGARGSDIYKLSEEIISSIEERFQVTLEREVNIH